MLTREREYELRRLAMEHAIALVPLGANHSIVLEAAQHFYDWLSDPKKRHHAHTPQAAPTKVAKVAKVAAKAPKATATKPAAKRAPRKVAATPKAAAPKVTPKAVTPKVVAAPPAAPPTPVPSVRKPGDLGGALRGEYAPPAKPPVKRGPGRPRKET
jgi:translation initiation factor IF-2